MEEERNMSIKEYVDEVVEMYEKDPFMFHRNNIKITGNNEYSLAIIEKMLRWRIPNLIITHSDTDTDEDIKKQIEKIRWLLDNDIGPYFIDFSHIKTEKVYLKKKGR